MEKRLNKIRKKIDSLDKALIKLLNKRSFLIKQASKIKVNEHPKIRFARETLMAYSLQKHDLGLYDTNFIQKIWRELISASLLIEGDLDIEVFNPHDTISPLFILARDHFGSYCNIKSNKSLQDLFNNISNNITTIGVIPFPNYDINWWDCITNYPDIKVNLTLPFIPPPSNIKNETGIVISKAKNESSMEDSSLFLVKNKNLQPLSNIKIILHQDDKFLVVLNGFTKNKELVSKFTNTPINQIYYLGSYPKPMFG